MGHLILLGNNIPLCPVMVSLQSKSQPGNKMSARIYLVDGSDSHPRHRDRVNSSLKCISSSTFVMSREGSGMSSNLLPRFFFVAHSCGIQDKNIHTAVAVVD